MTCVNVTFPRRDTRPVPRPRTGPDYEKSVMGWWMRWWPLLRDIALTGTGMGIIIVQVFSKHPDGLLLGTALALTVPSVAEHVKALLPGSGMPDTSPPSLPPGVPPSSPPQEVPGE